MRRREFFTAAAAVGAGAVVAGAATPAMAREKTPEKRAQVYKCVKCSTIVEIVEPGRPSLVHCGEPMELVEEQTGDPAENKHVPVIEKIDGGYKVKVGKAPHPMAEAHYIMWIDLLADGKTHRQFLKPGGAPEAIFFVKAREVSAREYCNLHGLWKDK